MLATLTDIHNIARPRRWAGERKVISDRDRPLLPFSPCIRGSGPNHIRDGLIAVAKGSVKCRVQAHSSSPLRRHHRPISERMHRWTTPCAGLLVHPSCDRSDGRCIRLSPPEPEVADGPPWQRVGTVPKLTQQPPQRLGPCEWDAYDLWPRLLMEPQQKRSAQVLGDGLVPSVLVHARVGFGGHLAAPSFAGMDGEGGSLIRQRGV